MIKSIAQKFDESIVTTLSIKGEYSKEITLEYLAICDLTTDDAGTVETVFREGQTTGLTIAAVAAEGDIITVASLPLMVTKIKTDRDREDPLTWHIMATALLQSPQISGDTPRFNITISFDGADYTEAVYQDVVTNGAIKNSSGQAYPDGIVEEFSDEEITVTFFTSSPPNLAPYRKKINSADFEVNGQGSL